MSVTTTKPLDLVLLAQQLAAAGISTGALGQSGALVHTYDAAGQPLDLPPAAQPVVDAHDYTQGATFQNEQSDGNDLAAFPTRAQVVNALSAIDTDLTTLSGAVTLAQAAPILRRTVQNQRAIIRALAVLVRRQGST